MPCEQSNTISVGTGWNQFAKNTTYSICRTTNFCVIIFSRYLKPNNPQKIHQVWTLGYSGKGVKVAIFDDGIDFTHPDLTHSKSNRRQRTKDIRRRDIQGENIHRLSEKHRGKHATQSAGLIVAKPGNGICGVGVAFNASIYSVRLVNRKHETRISDKQLANSLLSWINRTGIILINWGPRDDGTLFDGPDEFTQSILEESLPRGRSGKGTIIIYAGGNGGMRQDSCATDGFATNPKIFTINAVTSNNHKPFYTEQCSAILASTYSGGGKYPLITTDLDHGCSKEFTGTSAAASIAAGIVALVLEANSELTRRDLLHLVIQTANIKPIESDVFWLRNAAGFMFNPRFGFGIMDAEQMVTKAKTWTTVSKEINCFAPSSLCLTSSHNYTSRERIKLIYSIEVKPNKCAIKRLELARLSILLRTEKRGNTKLELESPSGTPSTVLPIRSNDDNPGFIEGVSWPFSSYAFWGEKATGVWKLSISAKKATEDPLQLTLILQGI